MKRRFLSLLSMSLLIALGLCGCDAEWSLARQRADTHLPDGDADGDGDGDGDADGDGDGDGDGDADADVEPDTIRTLFLMDQSASLQCTDPDRTRDTWFTERVEEIRETSSGLVGYVGFHADVFRIDFTTSSELIDEVSDVVYQLGPATDYQGALATAVDMMRDDMEALPNEERSTTAYVINFLSDGVPEPRCRAGCEDDTTNCTDGADNDGDSYIDGADEDCMSTSPDSLYMVCNYLDEIPENAYVDLEPCGEYNTVGQLSAVVGELRSLRDEYGIHSVTLNTYFLSESQDVVDARCGGSGDQFGYVCSQAIPLLQRMADEGGGEFNDDLAVPCEVETEDPPDAGTTTGDGGPPYECDDRFGDCGTPP